MLRNFSFPYFSRDIAEFWRRWHISLSSWFRDYLYIPLGGSKGGTWMKVRNTFIIFIVSGFWHGANWTFIIWGLLNAVYIMPSILFNTNRNNLDSVAQGRVLPTIRELIAMGITFSLTVFAWIFFRAESVQQAFGYINHMFSSSLLSVPLYNGIKRSAIVLVIVLVFFIVEWLGREQQHAMAKIPMARPVRWSIYYLLIITIYFFGNYSEKIEFIYFQF